MTSDAVGSERGDSSVAFEPIGYETTFEDELVWEIDTNWEVFGADGRRIGIVRDVQPYHLLVKNGLFRTEELVVPVTCIVDVRHERVYLSATRADLDRQQEQPAGAADGDNDTLVREAYDPELTIQLAAPSDLGPAPAVAETPSVPSLPPASAGPWIVARLVAESPATSRAPRSAPSATPLDAGLDAGDVRVERRRPVGRHHQDDGVAAPFAELDIFIPVRGEEPLVSTRPVVYEIVEVGRTLRERGGGD
jgi:hypothetical protein